MKLDKTLFFKANDQYFALDSLWKKVVRERSVTESRSRMNVIYRHAFSCICYNMSTLPVVQIASIINRDHATVLHAAKINATNRRYDQKYESVYLWLHGEICKVLKDHIDERSEAVMQRVRQTNPELDIESLIQSVKADVSIKFNLMKEENERLNKENKSLTKQFKVISSRNNILESELKRIKNLL
jgi:hypothetical protein